MQKFGSDFSSMIMRVSTCLTVTHSSLETAQSKAGWQQWQASQQLLPLWRSRTPQLSAVAAGARCASQHLSTTRTRAVSSLALSLESRVETSLVFAAQRKQVEWPNACSRVAPVRCEGACARTLALSAGAVSLACHRLRLYAPFVSFCVPFRRWVRRSSGSAG